MISGLNTDIPIAAGDHDDHVKLHHDLQYPLRAPSIVFAHSIRKDREQTASKGCGEKQEHVVPLDSSALNIPIAA